MRILVIGSGAREHALVWRLDEDPHPRTLFAAPGNPGIGSRARIVPAPAVGIPALVAAAEELNIDLTVVGPEAPLAAGTVDAFQARGLRIFGPTAGAAALEASKVFAKRLMLRYGIPTAAFEVFENGDDAIGYVRLQKRPLVVKADGLAGGKGVVVASDSTEAEAAILQFMGARVHGPAGARVVIEEKLEGIELSVFALMSGRRFILLPVAQDYKRISNGNRGPNTGGMGAVAPMPVPEALLQRIVADIVAPIADAMVREGRPYMGVLYAGLMVTNDGPYALEFNCRWGDPEAQVLLPLMQGDFAGAMLETLEGAPPPLAFRDGAAACVVLAARGYPEAPKLGDPIAGLENVPTDTLVFHAGTAVQQGSLITAGGRVLSVVGIARTAGEAAERAYQAVNQISFSGMQFRTDIGREALSAVGKRQQSVFGEPVARTTLAGGG